MVKNNQIKIYKSKTGSVGIKVTMDRDTVWLSQPQMAILFGKDVNTINEHTNNVYGEKELEKKSTTRKFRLVQIEGNREIRRNVDCYNLDVIISVGYRVKSLQGTQFRIWATKTLKQYLVKGYVLNQKRLKEQQKNLKILSDSVTMIKSKVALPLMVGQETELFEIVKTYIDSLRILKLYDDQELKTNKLKTPVKYSLEYVETTKNINELKQNLVKQKLASDNFGLENGQALQGLIGAISQTFDGKELYKSIEEKAANLLYFVIKDHPFVDGNKRIGSTLFIYFLSKNNYLFKINGESKINDRALVALALLVAVSNPQEKDIIIKLIINLIRD